MAAAITTLAVSAFAPYAWHARAAGATTQVMTPTAEAPADRVRAVDKVFAKWTASTPGCAVGVATGGTPALAKGYGMADLEHDVPITPETIFEAGSVSKQFTAAAVLLLARDGTLSIDDPVRKYIPELPEYAGNTPITIRHLLTHTSGLRDWGSVAAIAGWPRTTRVHTHAHVLDIVSRQHALNFPPGTRWSYSNTGFNLAAIIVSRVSGRSFGDITRERLFAPLGMTHTSWRDDYTRIVKGRAIAYDDRDGAFRTDMPFENVYGNGGLLTTVGDLLKWNERFATPAAGDAALVDEQQRAGTFADGRTHGYALGLFVGAYRGLHEVSHSGSTAGYSAFLTRFPAKHLSVAVLCNVTANATSFAHSVADAFIGGPVSASASGRAIPADEQERIVGLYRNVQTGVPQTFAVTSAGLRNENGPALSTTEPYRFSSAGGNRWEFDGKGGARVTDQYGTTDRFERVTKASPSAQDLRAYAGTYASDDAETTFTAAVDGDRLVLQQRPDRTLALTPIYVDAFRAPSLSLVIFRRDAAGRVVGLSVVQDRVWNMPFDRTKN
jgi:CubicO group peptidase (beta-lactamase class C family)